MFTTCKDVRRLHPEKNVNKPFENVSCQGEYPKIFSETRALNFDIFSSAFFAVE